MARKSGTRLRESDKRRISVTLPSDIVEDIKRFADERGVSCSSLYSQMMSDAYSNIKAMARLDDIEERIEMSYLGLEMLGARLDEIVKFLYVRIPSSSASGEEERQELRLKAQAMARSLSAKSEKSVLEWRQGDSNNDPLGVSSFCEKLARESRGETENTETL